MSRVKEERPHDEQWKLQLPTGYRFVPTDSELLRHYLFRKVNGLFIHAGIIHDVDVYECNPFNLPVMDREEEFTYFFTKREPKYPNGSNTDRSTRDGKGHWKITSKNTADQKLDYKTNWIMHEFVLDEKFFPSTSSSLAPKKQFNNFIVCRVYKRKIKGKEETDELKDWANSFIGPKPVMTHNDEEPSLKRKFEPDKETCDHPHDIAMNSNYYLYDSHKLQSAALLGDMKTNDFGQTSKTTSSSSPHSMVMENDPVEDPHNMTIRRDEEANNNSLDLANGLPEVTSGADFWDPLSRTPPPGTFNYSDYC
ncbi:hypothetical protein HAX54_026559 [Datura stramonium]|uniref:NAC domain-containing protein n=1 Tax=Datura stramonium TaxID=4076 RepID=A0ABS8V3A3_DATST|nr:hypothetical protein [Datura stramonium]